MIDFDALVLGPCMETFAIAAKVSRVTTAPGEAPFIIRGIFSSNPVDVEMQDGTILSDQQTSFGIRDSEIGREIGINDILQITDAAHPAYGRKFFIRDNDSDGQGGLVLTLGSRDNE